jgi:hypothetical protein
MQNMSQQRNRVKSDSGRRHGLILSSNAAEATLVARAQYMKSEDGWWILRGAARPRLRSSEKGSSGERKEALRASAENCPLNNEKMKAMTLELPAKLGGLEKKHEVKRISGRALLYVKKSALN